MIGEEERVLARLQDRGRLVAARLKEPVRRVVDVLHLETDTRAVLENPLGNLGGL